MPKLDFRFAGRRCSKKHSGKFRSGKLHSSSAERIHDVYCESIGRSHERFVLDIAEKEVRDILVEDEKRGRIEKTGFESELFAPYSAEDREGKDLRITLSLPEDLQGKSIFFQVKSSKTGARVFRERRGNRDYEIFVIVVGNNKDHQKDRLRIARFIAGTIRQEINKTRNQCEAPL
jgi:hypothetical protein